MWQQRARIPPLMRTFWEVLCLTDRDSSCTSVWVMPLTGRIFINVVWWKRLKFWDQENRNVFKVWLHSAPFIDPGICRNATAYVRLLSVRAPLFIYFQAEHCCLSHPGVYFPASKRHHWMNTLSPQKWNRALFFLCPLLGVVCFTASCPIVEEWAVEISAVLQYHGARLHLFYLVLNSHAI